MLFAVTRRPPKGGIPKGGSGNLNTIYKQMNNTYVYIYIYTYMYMYIYIYTHVYIGGGPQQEHDYGGNHMFQVLEEKQLKRVNWQKET